MSDEIPRVYTAIAEMESRLRDIGDWAKAFQAISFSELDVDMRAVRVMADALADAADDLSYSWNQALTLAREPGDPLPAGSLTGS